MNNNNTKIPFPMPKASSSEDKLNQTCHTLENFIKRAEEINIKDKVNKVNERVRYLQEESNKYQAAYKNLQMKNEALKNIITQLQDKMKRLSESESEIQLSTSNKSNEKRRKKEGKKLQAQRLTVEPIVKPEDKPESKLLSSNLSGIIDYDTAKILISAKNAFIKIVDSDVIKIKRLKLYYLEGKTQSDDDDDFIPSFRESFTENCMKAINELIAIKDRNDLLTKNSFGLPGKNYTGGTKAIVKVKFDVIVENREPAAALRAINVRLEEFAMNPVRISIQSKGSQSKNNIPGVITPSNRRSLVTTKHGNIIRSDITSKMRLLRESSMNLYENTEYENHIFVKESDLSEDCLKMLHKLNAFGSEENIYVHVYFDIIRSKGRRKYDEAKNVRLHLVEKE